MSKAMPRQEHPRPDFVRPLWLNLNGEWQFAFDERGEGVRLGYDQPAQALPLRIQVPFCPESKLSGLADKRYSKFLWYRRSFAVPKEMAGKRILIRFGAVDFQATVYVNGHVAGAHMGGYTPFSVDATDYLTEGENDLCVRVMDDRDCTQPRGKQYWKDGWMGCWYTPTSGIWQTVYLEAVGENYLLHAHVEPDFDQGMAKIRLTMKDIPDKALSASVEISYAGRPIRQATVSVDRRTVELAVSVKEMDLDEFHPWTPDDPSLYDVRFAIRSGEQVIDDVSTYFGMRKIAVKNGQVLLNNSPLYQRLVLDQGYWPDSLITPPSDEAIRADIEWTKKFGYNGARKHQKIEDPRYYYWADKLGLLVWGEVPSMYEFTCESMKHVSDALAGFIERDYNHPSLICWVPLNESWGVPRIYCDARQQQFGRMLYYECKALDGTRLVSTNDGWEVVDTDIVGLHDYAATGADIAAHFADRDQVMRTSNDWKMAAADTYVARGDEAIMVTEYGGIAYQDDAGAETWGYHDKVVGEDAFLARYKSVTDAVRAIPYCQGYCYTQLTDVQQETNGLLTPDRKPKVDVDKFCALTLKPAGRGGR